MSTLESRAKAAYETTTNSVVKAVLEQQAQGFRAAECDKVIEATWLAALIDFAKEERRLALDVARKKCEDRARQYDSHIDFLVCRAIETHEDREAIERLTELARAIRECADAIAALRDSEGT